MRGGLHTAINRPIVGSQASSPAPASAGVRRIRRSVFAVGHTRSLDPAFGTRGVASVGFPYAQLSTDSGRLVVVEPNGQFVVGSQTNTPTSNGPVEQLRITRYDANGTIDTTFGTSGTVYIPVWTAHGRVDGPWAAGEIVVVGSAAARRRHDDFAVQWYSSAGVFQQSTTTTLATSAQAGSVAVQSNGQVVVAGSKTNASGNGSQVIVARYRMPDGSLDSTFGSGGIATGPAGMSGPGRAGGVAIQANGQIVMSSSIPNPTEPSSRHSTSRRELRFNTNGSVDIAQVGTNGLAATPIGLVLSVSALAIEPNGQIVAGDGALLFLGPAGGDSFGIALYNTDGTFDHVGGRGPAQRHRQ